MNSFVTLQRDIVGRTLRDLNLPRCSVPFGIIGGARPDTYSPTFAQGCLFTCVRNQPRADRQTYTRTERRKGIIAKRSGGNGVRALMRRPRFDRSEEGHNSALSLLRRGWLAGSVQAAAAAVGRLSASIGSDERESRFHRVPQPQLRSSLSLHCPSSHTHPSCLPPSSPLPPLQPPFPLPQIIFCSQLP